MSKPNNSQEAKVAAAAPRNAAQASASQNAKVTAAAREAGVRVTSPKPAPSGRK